MIKIYGMPSCPDCSYLFEQIAGREDEFEFIDIGTGIRLTKEFLRLRDNSPVFDSCRKNGSAGVPAFLLEDGTVTLCPEEVGLKSRPIDLLIVVDMQKDFIDGALGTPEAVAIVPAVEAKIKGFDGTVLFTRDTHDENYMETQEGRNLPVPHCIKGTEGWQIRPELEALRTTEAFDKPTFGSTELQRWVTERAKTNPIASITLIGLCTDICVISNAMLLKAALPEVPVTVDAACCAGVTPESHRNALAAMKMCQIKVENE